jgi:hypothetical protein
MNRVSGRIYIRRIETDSMAILTALPPPEPVCMNIRTTNQRVAN